MRNINGKIRYGLLDLIGENVGNKSIRINKNTLIEKWGNEISLYYPAGEGNKIASFTDEEKGKYKVYLENLIYNERIGVTALNYVRAFTNRNEIARGKNNALINVDSDVIEIV